jgi:hypothetical protein
LTDIPGGDGRSQRRGRAVAPPRAVGVAWGWDADWFARDPAGYVAAHLVHLTSVTAAVVGRARRATQSAADARLDAGQSLRLLQRRLAARRAEGPATLSDDERRALTAFAVLERKLAEAAAEIAALDAPAPAAKPPARPAPRRPPDDAQELALALEAELHDG